MLSSKRFSLTIYADSIRSNTFHGADSVSDSVSFSTVAISHWIITIYLFIPKIWKCSFQLLHLIVRGSISFDETTTCKVTFLQLTLNCFGLTEFMSNEFRTN